jgi:hypothetical protein
MTGQGLDTGVGSVSKQHEREHPVVWIMAPLAAGAVDALPAGASVKIDPTRAHAAIQETRGLCNRITGNHIGKALGSQDHEIAVEYRQTLSRRIVKNLDTTRGHVGSGKFAFVAGFRAG